MRNNSDILEISAIVLTVSAQLLLIASQSIAAPLALAVSAAVLLFAAITRHPGSISGNVVRATLLAAAVPGITAALFYVVTNRWQGLSIAVWLLSIGVMCLFAPRASEKILLTPPAEPPLASATTRWVLLALCIGAALLFRTWQITSIPQSIWYDELMTAKDTLLVLEGGASPFHATPLALGDVVMNLYLYYVALIFKLFGVSYVSVKLFSIIPATAIVVATYFLGKKFMSRECAAMAAFFIAVSHWHTSISRLGWSNVMMSLLQVCSYAVFLSGMERKSKGLAFLSGLLIGLCCYTYAASRLALAIMLMYIVVIWCIRKEMRRPIIMQAAWFCLGCFVVLAPLGEYYIHNSQLLTHRINQVSIVDASAPLESLFRIAGNIKQYMLMFHVSGDPRNLFNPGGAVMLDPALGILFLAGIIYVAIRWRTAHNALLPIWLIGGLAGGVFSDAAPTGFRTFLIIPAVALTGGIAFERACRLSRLNSKKIFIATGLPLMVFMSVFNYNDYFGSDDFWHVWELNYLTAPTQIALRVQKLVPEHTVYVCDTPWKDNEPSVDTLKILCYRPYNEHTGRGGYDDPPFISRDLRTDPPWDVQPAQKTVYITQKDQKQLVMSLFPGGDWQEITNRVGKVLFCMYTL